MVSLPRLFWVFLVLGATSFGTSMVAYLRDRLVKREGWLREDEFLVVLEISQTLPGLNASNMAVIVGDRQRGPLGAVLATLGLLLPGGAVLFGLGALYASQGQTPALDSVLKGVSAAAAGLLLAVTWNLARPLVKSPRQVGLTLLTTAAVSGLHLSLPVVLLTIAPLSLWLARPRGCQP